MLFANIVIEKFQHGGWVMWPILVTFFLALCVLLERSLWWASLKRTIRRSQHEQARETLGTGRFDATWQIVGNSSDPFLINLRDGMTHAHTSMLAAMQLHASDLLEKAEARQWVLGTIITLAPLLGLLGTVVGIMGSFSSIGDDALAVSKVSGGIGEALIATAAGLGIAISCLLPYNYFRKRVAVLRGDFERWINHAELLVQNAKAHGHDLEAFAAARHINR
ncbi:MotA/TolQ/ExbB proton channel family protein [Luteolibacter ambystomatis]|uniref:MotA/TolQ/ExbB proton channel family protein n=1 Tax=Luteolibacter ambystomatis TaxID=2824561 RepID=A0A975G5Q6_9BACT|nr:MotA/TolQ/ExbB proton channel family protein [Luteolibacter ambystomatis]QUE49819.1 MotA/TolQ/ExbB proton channel family protein [Luteolibacter ambystomatis]